ncbi:MAG: nitrate- and nitrite sensing domain-containing protein [Pseudonocardia sp.]
MNIAERKSEWPERLQPRSWRLPVKLIAVVAVPTLLALILGVLRVLDQSATAAAFDQVNRLASVQQQLSTLTTELQAERDEVARFVAVRNRQDALPLQATFAASDAAREEVVRTIGDRSDLNSGTIGALRQVENSYFRLTQLRRQVLTGANDAADLITQYGQVVEPLLVFDNALTRQLSDPQISGLAQAIGVLGEAREQVSAQQALINSVLAAKVLSPEQSDALRAADARLLTATNTIRTVLTDDQQARYTGFTGPVSAEREQLKQSVVTRGRTDLPIEVTTQAWNDRSAAVLEQIDIAENGARDELRAISETQQDEASNLAGVSTVFLLLALLLGAGIVFLVARALISSLRTLRTSALDVAEKRLPEAVRSMREGVMPDTEVEPVPVTTREEIGQVARAFDAVHSQAVRLAAEQAALQSNVSSMFANLSRRSQALAERQLKLIEQLESNEQDPDQLSNLFQLDSLATRMRRNSENLLVLSGTDLSKRNTQPVPVVDVLRAAVSEVERYQRVVVQSPPEAMIAGRATSDIVHLLAELLDNATNFSAPDTHVVLGSQRTPDGSVLIEIVDRGVGMGAQEMTDANDRLARPTAMDVSTSRRMGLFVVGRLAARHGLNVQLGGGATTTGTTATVTVPTYLISPVDLPSGSTGLDAPALQLGAGRTGLPGRDFVPPQRADNNGRPALLPPRPQIADAPVGNSGGPGPLTPAINGSGTAAPNGSGVAVPNGSGGAASNGFGGAAPNGVEIFGPTGDSEPAEQIAEAPRINSLPSRRPGQSLGQISPAVPARPSARPKQPQPADTEPANPAESPTPARPADTDAAPEPEHKPEQPPMPEKPSSPEPQRCSESQPPVEPPVVQDQPVQEQQPTPITESLPISTPPRRTARPVDRPAEPSPAGLFAPATSAGPDAGAAMAGDVVRSQDDLSETTPIFEEIASAWFLSDRPVPVSYADRSGLSPKPGRPDQQFAAPVRLPQAARSTTATPAPSSVPTSTPTPTPTPASAPAPTPVESHSPVPPSEAVATFASAADDGWRASAAVAASDADEITPAGLPKRRPRARLVPGAAGATTAEGAAGTTAAPPAAPIRTAETIRGRLSSYQDGIRQGRENRLRREAAAAAGRPVESQNEETR